MPNSVPLLEEFDGIYLGKYSCGRRLGFDLYDGEGVMGFIAI